MPFNTEKLKNPLFWYKLIGAIILILILFWGFNYLVFSSAFCARCHVVKPYYESWLSSPHADVECSSCHLETGFINRMKSIPRMFSNGITFFVEGKIIKKGKKPSNNVCIVCHVIEREVTPGGDVRIPHTIHASMKGIYCVDCHKEFVHPKKKTAKSVPLMETCYNCHDGKTARDDCEICHTEKGMPSNHEASAWKEQHGLNVTDLEEECMGCHSKPPGFCTECHEKKPPSHAGNWDFTHSSVARVRSGGCLVCHKEEGFCMECHGESHPEGWINTHPNTAKTRGISSCYKCHGKKHCASCHTGQTD